MLPDAVGEHAPAFPLTFYLGTTGSKDHGASRTQKKPPLALQIQTTLPPCSHEIHELLTPPRLPRTRYTPNCGHLIRLAYVALREVGIYQSRY